MVILNHILNRGIIYEIGLMNPYSKQSTNEIFRSIYFFQIRKEPYPWRSWMIFKNNKNHRYAHNNLGLWFGSVLNVSMDYDLDFV